MKDTFENIEWIHGMLEFNSTGLWRIVIDNNTGVNSMYASKSMLKLLGLEEHPAPEVCYEHWFSRIESDYLEYVTNAVTEMLSTGEQIEIQYIWKHPSLGKIFVRCSGKLEESENNIHELRGYHQNISKIESHKAQQMMSVDEMKMAHKINDLEKETKRLNAQTDVWKHLMRTVLKNTDTFEIYYYPQKRQMCFPEEIAKRNHWNLEYNNMPYSFSRKHVDLESQDEYEAMFENLHEGIETTNSEVSFHNGKRWFTTNLSIIERDEDGNPLFAIGIVEDITERKINQLENLELQSIYKFTVNNDYECLFIIDLETNQYSIRYTENWQMYDVTEENIMPESFKSFLSKSVQPKDVKKFDLNHIIDQLNSKEENTYIIWYTATSKEHKEARCYWIEEDKKLLITVRDIETRWKQEAENKKKILEALEMAEAANQAKSDFLSRMSHDIRTPLNAVVGMVAIAKKYMNDTSKVEECLDSITNSSNYLTLLINDVLDMAKIENQKLRLSKENFILDEFLNKMLNVVKPLMDSRKHTLIVNCEEITNQKVKGDFVRLQQLLLNILSNAVKYTNTGGTIEFTIQEHPSEKEGYGFYRFEVKDNGIGMDAEFLERLFNPFERKDSERVGHIEGTGLGMSIAKNIANLMEGDIYVESEPDVGSKFTIEVYLELQGENDDCEYVYLDDEFEKGLPDFSGRTILLVEDNAINMEIAEEILSATGAVIETAENGSEAVEKVQESEEDYYSMIFMDIRMPIMNGYEATGIIRGLHREDVKNIPIIAMTADAFTEDIKRARDCGMNDHIAKPIDIDKLYDVMRKYDKKIGGGSNPNENVGMYRINRRSE
uniref:ATP-binding protein n=1 Tax=Agathobacter sp. TaxID=2021311 RepID=UPI004056083F